MPSRHVTSTVPRGRLGRVVVLLSLGLAMLSAQNAQAQAPPLTFFKNYFITGDYVVGGVGLRGQGVNGLATGSIQINGVPAEADIVAAFLYWQVVTTTSAGPDSGSLAVTFKGYPLRSAEGPFAKVLTTAGTSPCWASGGTTGSSGGSKATYTYRADVLRYFDVDEATGKFSVNGSHLVGVPDSGSNGNATPLALGASLVVIYRQSTLPLSAIVIYDGGYTLNNDTGAMFQTIGGFYQPANPAVAKLTHIVGSGQANKSETLLFGAGTAAPAPIAQNPFSASLGGSWDNPTFEVSLGASPGSVSQVTTGVSPSSDCLTWGAVIFKTEVQDTDGDGLLDIWESSDAPILDPNGEALPHLKAMGADPYQKDLFIEVGYMKTDVETAYGGVLKPAHSHLPTHAALKLMGDAFANAPTGRINVHFDVGNDYPAGVADQYIIRGEGLARGGEAIDEMDTVCDPDPERPWVCQFSEYPGTVGWKTGFQFLRDQVLSGEPPPLAGEDDPCDAPGNTCVRRFDRNRKDMFHYVLFAHALGLPKSEEPTDPDFRVPRTNTGVGDFPGGDVMVTLGAFADHDGLPVGTPFMQASTLMHELGHNMDRRHGGEAFEPNCKPTYLSVMNYLYQLRGLLDDRGVPHLDFSASTYGWINETSLSDGLFNGLRYRIGWYAPLEGSYLEGRASPARRHCDGSDLLETDVPMVRIDARTASGVIDWNANGVVDSSFSLDVNFNGRVDDLGSSDDWSNLRLNQVGARRNTGGLFVVDVVNGVSRLLVGPLSLATGRGDLGRGDLGRGDLGGEMGRGDLGRGDLGRGDLGRGDLGRGDLGRGDLGRGDLGRGDLGRGDLGRGDLGGGDLFVGNPYLEGELDAETAGDLARTPPNEFTACVVGVDCLDPEPGTRLHAVRLGWTPPNVGGVSRYEVYRVAGDTLVPDTPQTPWTRAGQVEFSPGQLAYALVDDAQLSDGALYTYFALAIYADGVQSDPSNLVTITAVNDPPAAGNDSFSTAEDTPLNQAAPGVLANDADPDSPSTLEAVLVSPPSQGTLTLHADGSFDYTPAANYYGTDTFTYKARASYGAGDPTADSNVATVTITVTPVNDPPTISDIADLTVDWNTGTGPLAFTIGDPDGLAGAVLSGASSNPTLVPAGNIVFGGSNEARTVTVTPAPNQSGDVTITVTVTDTEGLAASATFLLTVRQANYSFVNVQNAPPPAGRASSFKAGSAIPMKWRFENGSTPVDSAHLGHSVTVQGPLPNGPVRTITNTAPGSSWFRYDASTMTWQFNLQTKDANGKNYPLGTYRVTITPDNPAYLPSPSFEITLVK